MTDIVLNLTITELAALIGLVHSVYILVYISFRTTKISVAVVPFCFFLLLGSGFFIIIANKYWLLTEEVYTEINWFSWTLCAPLSSLLIIQIAKMSEPLSVRYYLITLMVPFAYLVSSYMSRNYQVDFSNLLPVSSILVGTLSLLLIWLKRQELDRLHKRQYGKERYWLIISLIILNLALIGSNLTFLNTAEVDLIRILLGLGFLYVTSTSLLRVYPPIIKDNLSSRSKNELSSKEIEIALEVENLLHVQNVYQESNYNRAAMAQELKVPETQLSRIINLYFQKSVPLLLNELRVKEAQILLKDTQEDISVIAEESGFNSIATFNRVFKDLTGVSPKVYRER